MKKRVRRVRRKQKGLPDKLAVLIFLAGILVGCGGYYLLERVPELLEEIRLIDIETWLENASGASVPILAVASGEEQFGVAATLAVKVVPGNGGIYIDIDPMLVGFEFQDAARTAVEVARTQAGLPVDPNDQSGIKDYDVMFLVVGPGEKVQIQAIDGPSAGAATALALMAVLENKHLKEDYVITGTIEADGSIGQVGGVFYKAQAAHEIGATHMLVPPGQSVVTVYKQVTRRIGPWQFVSYVPETLDLNEYSEQQGWGLEIIEVSNIEEAAALMLE